MNSPYTGRFFISQGFRPASNPTHDGIDLVGRDSKEIHSTAEGKIRFAGWENPADHKQGFGQYMCILGNDGLYYYFGHLSEIRMQVGENVKIGDILGIEGSTGRSTGSHCHYEIRREFRKGAQVVNVCDKSGIPNNEGCTYSSDTAEEDSVLQLQRILNDKGAYLDEDGIAGEKTLAECRRYTIDLGDSGPLTHWVQARLNSVGFDCGTADGIAGTRTMCAIYAFQQANRLGTGYLGGSDWNRLIN